MDIKYFKKNFVDFIDDCNECGVLANIQVQNGYFKHLWWGGCK